MMEQSIPSARLQMTQKWEVQLVCYHANCVQFWASLSSKRKLWTYWRVKESNEGL